MTREFFLIRAKAVHGDRYDYGLLPEQMRHNEQVPIVCSAHGKFMQRCHDHTACRSGCPKCKSEQHANRRRKTVERFVEQAKVVHGDKYEYSRVQYKTDYIKVEIICRTHGSFWQRPTSHLQRCGCPQCGRENRMMRLNRTRTNIC